MTKDPSTMVPDPTTTDPDPTTMDLESRSIIYTHVMIHCTFGAGGMLDCQVSY